MDDKYYKTTAWVEKVRREKSQGDGKARRREIEKDLPDDVREYKIWFGKYKGQRVLDVVVTEPNYGRFVLRDFKGAQYEKLKAVIELGMRLHWPHSK